MGSGCYQRSADFREIIKAGIKARKTSGLPFGRPALFMIEMATCVVCQTQFEYKHYPSKAPRVCCGPPCARVCGRESRRKVPNDRELLFDMYWNRNMTTPEIAARFATDHSVIKRRMNQLNIPRRKRGVSRHTICIEDNCDRPAFKLLHKKNGSYYGRRCLDHWRKHRIRICTAYYQSTFNQSVLLNAILKGRVDNKVNRREALEIIRLASSRGEQAVEDEMRFWMTPIPQTMRTQNVLGIMMERLSIE